MTNKLHHPHDQILKKQLENIRVARDFLKASVPDIVRHDIQWETLTAEKNSYISPDLKAFESDVVFSAKLNNDKPLKITIYIELESVAKHSLMIRFQRYVALAIENIYRNNPTEKLPLILPMCLYTGSKPFPYPTSLVDYFQDPKLAKKLLQTSITMIDVASMKGSELDKFKAVSFLIMLPLLVRSRDFLELFHQQLNQGKVEKYFDVYGVDELESIVQYILGTIEPYEKESFVNMLQRKMPHYIQEVRTAADAIRLEGFEEGEYQIKMKTAKILLKEGVFSSSKVSKILDLPLSEVEQCVGELIDN